MYDEKLICNLIVFVAKFGIAQGKTGRLFDRCFTLLLQLSCTLLLRELVEEMQHKNKSLVAQMEHETNTIYFYFSPTKLLQTLRPLFYALHSPLLRRPPTLPRANFAGTCLCIITPHQTISVARWNYIIECPRF